MRNYTTKDWERDGSLSPKIGQGVEDAIYFQMLEAVPPTTHKKGLFQAGEPYTHDPSGHPLFFTLEKEEKCKTWIFTGYKRKIIR